MYVIEAPAAALFQRSPLSADTRIHGEGGNTPLKAGLLPVLNCGDKRGGCQELGDGERIQRGK
jgi:hypothetical protein